MRGSTVPVLSTVSTITLSRLIPAPEGCLIPPLASAFNGSHTLAVKRWKD